MESKLHIPQNIRDLCDHPVLKDRVIIVGGACRDHILGIEPKDFDLLTTATPDELTEAGFTLAHTSAPVFMAKAGDELVEIACTRKEIQEGSTSEDMAFETGVSFKEDFRRRDFTCNAIGFSPHLNLWYDPFQGMKDIGINLLRMVSRHNFLQSPERILRAFMHVSRFGFSLDLQLTQAIKENLNTVKSIPTEQIWKQGFHKLFKGENWSVALFLMNDLQVDKALGLDFWDLPMKTPKLRDLDSKLIWLMRHLSEDSLSQLETLQFLNHESNWKRRLKTLQKMIDVCEWAQRESTFNVTQTANLMVTKLSKTTVRGGELAAAMEPIDKRFRNFLSTELMTEVISELQHRDVWATAVTSDDLLELGLKPGKLFGTTLRVGRFLQDVVPNL